jgi:hypothetical protein
MKNPLYYIAGLLVLLWGVITFGFGSSLIVNLLLVLAGFIILLQLFYSKKSSKKI